MKNHQFIFNKIKTLLKLQLGDRLIVDLENHDDGYSEIHLSIADTGIWISCDNSEIILGSGLIHEHYNSEFYDMNSFIENVFNLLTQRRRLTEYYKGDTLYKMKMEVEAANGQFKELGIAKNWLYAFWKPTIEKVFYEDRLLNAVDIRGEIDEIKSID